MRRVAAVVGALVALPLGCAGKKYYALEYRLDARALNAEGVRFPPAKARELLRRAKVVAFAPPDECDESAGTDVSLIRARCGEVMAGLEEAAGQAGFEVVSWQALHGSEPPLVYARRQKVDALFEVNRTGVEFNSADVQAVGRMRFLAIGAGGNAKPVPVGDGVRRRCRSLLSEGVGDSAGVLLDVKLVSVKDGLTMWNYRWLFSTLELGGQASRIYFKAGAKKSGARVGLLIGGGALLGIGAVLLGAGIPLDNEKLAGAGALTAGVGGLLMFLGRPGTESAGGDALCGKPPVADPFAAAAPAGEGPSSDGGEVRFTKQGTGGAEGRVRPVARLAAREFVELVQALRDVGSRKAAPRKARPARRRKSSGCALMRAWLAEGTPGLTRANVARHCK